MAARAALSAVAALTACTFTPGLAHDAAPVRDGDGDGERMMIDADGGPLPPGRKKSITIDGARVTGSNADFPVWIDVTDLQVGTRAQVTGSDLWFSDGAGTPLDHEIQRWDKVSSHLQAWVRVPAVAAGANMLLYLHYGDTSIIQAPNAPGVFRASFHAVWHLDDSLAAAPIAEATNARPATGTGLAPARSVAARLGNGVSFTGGTEQITFTNPITGNGPHTISLWVSQTATSDNDAMVVLATGACGQARWFHSRFDAGHVAAGFYCNDWPDTGSNVVGGGLTLLHWVFEGANNTSRLYRDGAQVASFLHTGTAVATAGTGGLLGNAPGAFGGNMGFHGVLDEVRIASVARSAGWIATEYANQSSPSTFYIVGPEQLP